MLIRADLLNAAYLQTLYHTPAPVHHEPLSDAQWQAVLQELQEVAPTPGGTLQQLSTTIGGVMSRMSSAGGAVKERLAATSLTAIASMRMPSSITALILSRRSSSAGGGGSQAETAPPPSPAAPHHQQPDSYMQSAAAGREDGVQAEGTVEQAGQPSEAGQQSELRGPAQARSWLSWLRGGSKAHTPWQA